MRDAAVGLKTPTGWSLISDEETLRAGKGQFCLVLYCPHLERVWDMASTKLDCASLQQFLRESGYGVITHRVNYVPQANEELASRATARSRSATLKRRSCEDLHEPTFPPATDSLWGSPSRALPAA